MAIENRKRRFKRNVKYSNKQDINIPLLNMIFYTDKGINDKSTEEVNKKDEKKQTDNYFTETPELLSLDDITINTISDLIALGKKYNPLDKNRYTINLRLLHKCIPSLEELDNMIGMLNVKQMIINLFLFKLQNFIENSEELYHLVLTGNPGTGKTEVSQIIGKIYRALGIIERDLFIKVKRNDLIGSYCGHTADMTRKMFNRAKGGILFIDEAYSLGDTNMKDSFSKECIDTINQELTDNKDTVVIIAGYKDQLNDSFFNINPGLNRRFKFRINIEDYTYEDLRKIYIKKIRDSKWQILNNNTDEHIPLSFFEKNYNIFKYNGGDMENLWHLTRISHAKRIFGKSHNLIKQITQNDLNDALNEYLKNDEVKTRQKNIFYSTFYV